MKVYVAHSKLIDYKKELYEPIRGDLELQKYDFYLPHEESSTSSNTRDFYKKIDVVFAEVSAPASGLGIELGWAYDDGTPIYCFSKKGSKVSGSLHSVSTHFYEYENTSELLSLMKDILENVLPKKRERQYCASSYIIDFQEEKTLLMYNKKLHKWLQPGGHIEGLETPEDACIREAKEETGIDIKVIGPEFLDGKVEPIAVERYVNSIGDMIDIQFLAIPLTHQISSPEGNSVSWIGLHELEEKEDVDSEIKFKVKKLYEKYK